jgi:hypothetical protein
MSDDMKKLYKEKGLLANFFETATPVNLYRRRNVGDKTPIMQPTVIGFGPADEPRRPDIFLTDERDASPQHEADATTILREPGSKPLTKQIIAGASKYTVKGCRATAGPYRGVSVFDQANSVTAKHEWFCIPDGTEIPPALAVTREGVKTPGKPQHYTIAPKDDMPFTLFLQHLKGFEAILKKQTT